MAKWFGNCCTFFFSANYELKQNISQLHSFYIRLHLSTADIVNISSVCSALRRKSKLEKLFSQISLLLFIFLEVENKPICYNLGQWGEVLTNQKGRPSAPWPFWLFLAGFQVGRRQLFDSCLLLPTRTWDQLAKALHKILVQESSLLSLDQVKPVYLCSSLPAILLHLRGHSRDWLPSCNTFRFSLYP